MSEYRKISVISPGLIQLRKVFWVGLLAKGLIYGRGGGGGGGLTGGIKKKRFEASYGSVDRNMFLS